MPIPFLAEDDFRTPFPDVNTALEEPNGLLMAGGSLQPERLLRAYRRGIFPWYEQGEPILWWAPDPRCVIKPGEFKASRSLRKTLRSGRFTVTHDAAFREVMQACAAPRPGSQGTWITTDMIDAYCRLATVKAARSIEVWDGDTLVGGLYGVAMGKVFIGESMFSRVSDASKVALAHLASDPHYELIDCQLPTEHLMSLGATTIPRREYSELLDKLANLTDTAHLAILSLVEPMPEGPPTADRQ